MKHPIIWIAAILMALSGCTETVPVSRDETATRDDAARILLMGDSLLAAHGLTGNSVSYAVERQLGEQVIDRSVIGARMIYALPITGAAGMNIPKQYRPGKWDWVILNGGGNDLWWGCGCAGCETKMNRLISGDGRRGVVPGLVSRLRQDGAQVIFVGYLRTPGVTSPIEHCVDEGAEYEGRIARLAGLDKGVHFLSLADLVPDGDRSYHAIDLIHPSIKASNAIGQRIARLIRPE